MKPNYINLYNKLIQLTTNKYLYKGIVNKQDTFSDRLTFFLLHFAFFLKEFKNSENKVILQDIYDFNFRQLELSIREIGYGDQSINKKMKQYINLFHDILGKIHYWDDKNETEKSNILKEYIDTNKDISFLKEYLDKFNDDLKNNTLNFHKKV
tara:strand:+ start:899 stop:1357 length:459 start_codon:yes stop_codon:yes gene_type:complete